MFEFDAGKLVIIGIVALIFIGPKELPRVLRQVGQAVAKIRRLGAEFQAQFMEAMREADLEEIKAQAAKISESAKLDAGLDPLAGIRAELTKNIAEMSETIAQPATDEPAALPVPSAAGSLEEALANGSFEGHRRETVLPDEARETALPDEDRATATPETDDAANPVGAVTEPAAPAVEPYSEPLSKRA